MNMDHWIPVLVPEGLLPAVTKAVSEAVRAHPDTDLSRITIDTSAALDKPAADTALPHPNTGGEHEARRLARHRAWSKADLVRLAAGDTATTARWARALDACSAAGPGVWLSTSDIAERTGMTINEWRDAPRKISRHLAKHYQTVPTNEDGDHFWPLAVGGDGIEDNGGEVWWAITVVQKERWDQIRADESE